MAVSHIFCGFIVSSISGPALAIVTVLDVITCYSAVTPLTLGSNGCYVNCTIKIYLQ